MDDPVRGQTRRFAVWVGLGACVGVGLLAAFTPLILLLPVAAGVAFLLLRRRPLGRDALGLVSGFGLVLLVVAWLNRGGPGDVCRTVGGSQDCVTSWSPWPWLVAGLVCLLGGVALAQLRRVGPSRPRLHH